MLLFIFKWLSMFRVLYIVIIWVYICWILCFARWYLRHDDCIMSLSRVISYMLTAYNDLYTICFHIALIVVNDDHHYLDMIMMTLRDANMILSRWNAQMSLVGISRTIHRMIWCATWNRGLWDDHEFDVTRLIMSWLSANSWWLMSSLKDFAYWLWWFWKNKWCCKTIFISLIISNCVKIVIARYKILIFDHDAAWHDNTYIDHRKCNQKYHWTHWNTIQNIL